MKCVSCGADVARNAKACPTCGEVKPGQPWWVYPAALVFLLALLVYWVAHGAAHADDLPYPAEPEIPEWAILYKTLADCQPAPTTEAGAKVCLKAVTQFYAAWLRTPPEVREDCIKEADDQEAVNSLLGQSKQFALWACIEAAK
jgi:hypothetical protein